MGVTLEEPHGARAARMRAGKAQAPPGIEERTLLWGPGHGKEILCCEAQKSCLKWGSSTLALLKSGAQPLLLEWGSGATPCNDGG